MTVIIEPAAAKLSFVQLEITGECQLACQGCYAESGPGRGHGFMRLADWLSVLDQCAELEVDMVQMIGGEPTLHPDLPALIRYALDRGIPRVEVYSNLVKVTGEQWEVFALPGVSLATSYYSDDPGQHAEITGRNTHARTKANIAEARRRGIEVRVAVVDHGHGQRAEQGQTEIAELGVPRVSVGPLRQIGRANPAGSCGAEQLCGACGYGSVAVGPDGQVWPCVMSRNVRTLGDVRQQQLGELAAGLPGARAELLAAGMPAAGSCAPQGGNCYPVNCHPRW